MIRHRLTIECDHAGCTELALSAPLRFHGSIADLDGLIAAALEMGWKYVPAVPVEAGPDGSVRVEGPWHYCPAHAGMKDEG